MKPAPQGLLFSGPPENTCKRCGYRTVLAPIQCPQCRGLACFVDGGAGEVPLWAPQKLAKVKRLKVERLKLHHPALDEFFNGGLVKTCAYYFTGPPGAGKSRFALQACQWFKNPLYLAGEESADLIKLRQHDLKIDLPNLSVVETGDMELVAKNISNEYDAVILDSAHVFRTADVGGSVGSTLMVESVVRLATDIARKLVQTWIIVGHVNADGAQSGKVANIHHVDAHVVIEVPDPKKTARVLAFNGKHRHGPTNMRVACEMTGGGLDNFRLIREDEEEKAGSPREE